MPTVVMMSGPPGSGKSTQAAIWKKKLVNPLYLSTDEFIERYARFIGKTYEQAFSSKVFTHAKKRMAKLIAKAKAEGRSVIWDQTSLRMTDRVEKAYQFVDWKKVLCYAKKPDKEELKERNKTRPRGPLSWFKVIGPMVKNYEYPSEVELKDMWDESYEF